MVGVAVDLYAKTLDFYKNGVLQGRAYANLDGTIYPMISIFNTCRVIGIFDVGNMIHAIPEGYIP